MIFLGQASNYSFGQTVRHLFAFGTENDSRELRLALAKRYGKSLPSAESSKSAKPSKPAKASSSTKTAKAAQSSKTSSSAKVAGLSPALSEGSQSHNVHNNIHNVALYHTGRSALTVAFHSLAPGRPVILPGLTCIAVVRAIKAASCRPEFVDIDPQTLQYDFVKLEKTCANLARQAKKATSAAKTIDNSNKVCYNGCIVAQNTLGLPLDMGKLEKIAHQYNFAIVEDLAHCAGRFYPDGRAIGTVGEATALSFGKGKAIDTIEGGALILRTHKVTHPLSQPEYLPKFAARARDRLYPLFGAIARGLWHIGLGRVWLGALHKLHLIERSADAALETDVRLTHWQAKLAHAQLAHLPRTPLREHYLVRDRDDLLRRLEDCGYILNEIWYDAPVSPARYAREAHFPVTTCPNTIAVAKSIINLPTWHPAAKLDELRFLIEKYIIPPEKVKHD